MSVFDWAFKRTRPQEERQMLTGATADSGRPVSKLLGSSTDRLYVRDSTAYACIRTIAEACATLPFRAVRAADGVEVEPGTSTNAASFNRIMTRRVDGLTPFVFWLQVFTDMAKVGNGFVLPVYALDRLVDLRRVAPSRVNLRLNEANRVVYEVDGEDLGNVLHLRSAMLDRDDALKGTPPLGDDVPLAQLTTAADEWVLGRLKDGTPPVDILLSDEPFTADEIDSLRDVERRSPRFGVRFGGGIRDVKTYGASPQNADMKDLREQVVMTVARRYGVPAPIIGLNITQWGSGVEALARMFYRFTLRGYLMNVEAAVSTLFGDKFVARFDVAPLLMPDADTKAKVTNALTAASAVTVNEVRKLWGYPPVEDGDVITSSTSPAPYPTGAEEPDVQLPA